MKLKIKSVNFQRNGVHGEPFYSVLYTEGKHQFLATFRTEEGETKELIVSSSCRVVSLENHASCWRGDEISVNIEKALNELMKQYKTKSFYGITGSVLALKLNPLTSINP